MGALVIKHNNLINASYSMSLVEQRLILLAIIAARENNITITDNRKLLVSASTYERQFNVARQAAYMALKEACSDLFERRFSFEEHNGKVKQVKSRWVQRIAYIEEHAEVEIMFSSDIIPFITELEKRFTQYELDQIVDLSSAYAVRLYELLIAWRSSGKIPLIELHELRSRLGLLNNEYNRMTDFKRRVLDLAVEQINKNTDITVNYEQHKKGRVITGFSFTFKFKKPSKTTNKTALGSPPTLDPDAEKRETYAQFLNYQRQAKLLKETIEQLATEKEIQQFREYGLMK